MRRTLAVLALSALLAAGGAGCSRGASQALRPPTPSATTTSPRPTPKPAVNPLTGLAGAPAPVVAVKIDNAPSARPLQRGLTRAAVIYQELVEGGTTRFMAIYSGRGSFDVGPVRSARISDLDVLAQYGKVAFAFSGAQGGVFRAVRAANVFEVSQDRMPATYQLRGRRMEAYNFYTTPARVLGRAPGAALTRDVGLRFGPAAAAGTRVTAPVRVAFSPLASVTFRWDAARHGWRLSQEGRPMTLADGGVVAPQNIVVQSVPVRLGRFHDRWGHNSPETISVGRGAVAVYRDGRRYNGSWVRATRTVGTRFVAANGRDIPLRPGHTWVLLVPAGR